MASYARLGLALPEPPSYDVTTQQVVQAFILIARARNYHDGKPLPLTVRDITDVVTVHPINMPRSILDYIIFALDDLALNQQSKAKQDS